MKRLTVLLLLAMSLSAEDKKGPVVDHLHWVKYLLAQRNVDIMKPAYDAAQVGLAIDAKCAWCQIVVQNYNTVLGDQNTAAKVIIDDCGKGYRASIDARTQEPGCTPDQPPAPKEEVKQ